MTIALNVKNVNMNVNVNQLTTRKRAERTKHDFRCSVCRPSQLFDLRTPSSTDVPVLLLNQPHPNIPFRRNKQSKKKVRRKGGRNVNSNNNKKIITNFPEFFEFITNTAPQVSNSIYRQNFMEIILLNIIIFLVEDILGGVAQWSRRRPSAQMCQVRFSVKPFFLCCIYFFVLFLFCF